MLASRQRHDTVILCTAPTDNCWCGSRESLGLRNIRPPFWSARRLACQDFHLVTIAALHQGNYATIPNYLERELRYMDAGEEAQSATAGPKGTPGYQ